MPGITFLLLLLSQTDSPVTRRRVISLAAVACGLAIGIVGYRIPEFQSGPSWQAEVRQWRANPSYKLQVWPSSFGSGISYP
jgi:hypothetical protein